MNLKLSSNSLNSINFNGGNLGYNSYVILQRLFDKNVNGTGAKVTIKYGSAERYETGQAIIESIEQNDEAKEKSTYSVSFVGCGGNGGSGGSGSGVK